MYFSGSGYDLWVVEIKKQNSTLRKFNYGHYFNFIKKMDALVFAAQEAGKRIIEIYNSLGNDLLKVVSKEDGSPLTLADRESNDIIVEILRKHYPGIPILSEESREVPYEERKDWDEFFLVDPLDGTKEFIKRNGQFTVNIGWIKDREPFAGVVSIPCRGEIFWAERGKGAWLLKDGNLTPIHARKRPTIPTVLSSLSHMNEETAKYIEKHWPEHILDKYGSSLKFMQIARGDADIYSRLVPCMEWDTAASHAILLESGCILLDLDGKPIPYNKPDLHQPFFVASNHNYSE